MKLQDPLLLQSIPYETQTYPIPGTIEHSNYTLQTLRHNVAITTVNSL